MIAQAAIHAAPAPSAAAVLAQVRAATLFRPLGSISTIRTAGSLIAVGLHAQTTEWDDVARGRFVQITSSTNFLAGKDGYDGDTSWSQDASGIVRVDGGESTRLQNVDQAYMVSFSYLKPGFGGASATFVGERHEAGHAYDVVEVTPAGGSPIDLWVDAKSHYIAKVVETIGLVTAMSTFADYRRVSGVEIPFYVDSSDSDGNDSTLTVNACTINAPGIDALVAVPSSDAHDFSIAGGTTTVPIEIVNNHIYVHVMLDGHGPYTFVFDTGGANIVTPEVAAALHAQSAGGAHVGGVGNTTEGAQFTRIDAMSIGSATIRNQQFLVLPIGTGFGVAEGMSIDGMFGPAVPDRFLTTIDYAARTLTLSLGGQPSGTAIPFFFDGTIPKIHTSIDGIDARTDLDTGNRGQLFLTTPFLAAHPVLSQSERTGNAVTGFGVGGPSYGKLGRIATVQIGPYTLHDVVTDFGTQTKGATADPFTDANVGGGLWSRFVLTLDYAHQRIFLLPNADYGTPLGYDRSGAFLIDYGGNVTVLDALAGTPADAAGLKKGDVILAVDGKPASSYTLAQVRTLFMSAPGTVVHLHIRSGTAERDVALTLADYV